MKTSVCKQDTILSQVAKRQIKHIKYLAANNNLTYASYAYILNKDNNKKDFKTYVYKHTTIPQERLKTKL